MDSHPIAWRRGVGEPGTMAIFAPVRLVGRVVRTKFRALCAAKHPYTAQTVRTPYDGMYRAGEGVRYGSVWVQVEDWVMDWMKDWMTHSTIIKFMVSIGLINIDNIIWLVVWNHGVL